jgi:hypothetical protein
MGADFSRFTAHVRAGVAKRYDAVRGPVRFGFEFAGLRYGALPDYLVIGAMKSGTTTFYDWLVRHPLVPSAVTKEIHFFDSHFPQGLTWYRSQLPTVRQLAGLSRTHSSRGLSGEATPTYLFHPLAARRAHSVVPDAKLIVLLRNPIDRAYSHYQTNIRHDWEALSFEEALDREEERLDGQIDVILKDEKNHRSFARFRWSYRAMGHYAELIENWMRYYPLEQFHFVLNEELDSDPDTTYAKVYEFLGLPDHPLGKPARRTIGHYSSMAAPTRAGLVEYFRPHNARLEALLGRSVDWDR